MKGFFKNRWRTAVIGILSLAFVWCVWVIAGNFVKNEYVIPSVSETLSALGQVLSEAFFWRALLRTLIRVAVAFLLSFVLGGALAVLGRVFKPFGTFLKPIISVIRTLPTMAVLVLILIYTTRTVAPVVVAVLVLFPMIYSQFTTAFGGVDDGLLDTAKVFNLSARTKILKVFLPITAPAILSHVGTNLSFGIKLIVSAEVMAYTYTSLGGMMMAANSMFEVARLMALTLVAVILGLVIELVFHLINKACFKWNKTEDENG